MAKGICYISPMSIHSTRWIEAVHQKGYDVSLITDLRTWIAPMPHNVPIYFLPTLNIKNVHYRLIPNYVSIVKILRKINPDLVHLHFQHHYGPAVILSNIPYVLHSWGLEVLELNKMSIFRKILAKYVAMKSKKIVVDAECMKQIWTHIGIPENKVEVIPFGVDTKIFNPTVNGNDIRKRLGIKENNITIISTRPFFNHYNVECLIKAIPMVVKTYNHVKFIVKGRGPLENSLKRIAKELRVDKYIRFTNPVPYHEMSQYFAAADIYVSTSFKDSTSVSLLEAMACGLACIVTDIPGNREWIKDGINGLLYEPTNSEALAQRITHLIENENFRERLGEKSHRIIERRAAWEKCVSKMEAIYQSIQ